MGCEALHDYTPLTVRGREGLEVPDSLRGPSVCIPLNLGPGKE